MDLRRRRNVHNRRVRNGNHGRRIPFYCTRNMKAKIVTNNIDKYGEYMNL